jgi:cell division protein FtsX
MTDAAHVRDALARFNQVGAVTDAERDLACANLKKAAGHFAIQMKETNWHQFGK